MLTRENCLKLFDCPITLYPIKGEALILPTGQTCDASAINTWIEEKYTNPFTREIIYSSDTLIANHVYSALLDCLSEGDTANGTLLDWLRCPISGEYFTDPVVAMDGYTYERKALASYLHWHFNKSPRGFYQSLPLSLNFTHPVKAVDKCIYEKADIVRYLSSTRRITPNGLEQKSEIPLINVDPNSLPLTPRYSNLIVQALLGCDYIKTLIKADEMGLSSAGANEPLANPVRTYLKTRLTESPYQFFYYQDSTSKWYKEHAARQVLRALSTNTFFKFTDKERYALTRGRLGVAASSALHHLSKQGPAA